MPVDEYDVDAESAPGSEDLESFRLRAREWLRDNMPPLPEGKNNAQLSREDETGEWAKALQRKLFEGGFAGICFPREYGGQGLSRSYQRAFTQESLPYQMPTVLNVPTLSILAATLLDFGSEEQKQRHIPAILRGDEMWVQFLSEPSGGSDLAGLVTRATRDGDVFILNGSKIWSTGAHKCDYAMCLARTDWQVPKHRGLTMFLMKIHQPGVEVQQIRMNNGTAEFCQEFFDDVVIPASDVIGDVDDGWTVASRLLYHERDAVGGGSPFISGTAVAGAGHGTQRADLVELARRSGKASDARVRQLVAEDRINDRVQHQLVQRISTGIRTRALPPPAGAIARLMAAITSERHLDIALDIAGPSIGAWLGDEGSGGGGATGMLGVTNWGDAYLIRQGGSLGGGSTEMQRNIISERVLGMPREYAADRELPFDQVRHN
jgi:alkylation response protein AidB-like acyl-CoA dehydrogenase